MIGSPSQLFLATASFAFELEDDGDDPTSSTDDDSGFVATIGTLRLYGGGLDALAVSSSSVVAVGQVIESADTAVDDPADSELSRFWLGDIVRDRKFSLDSSSQLDFFVWILEHPSGRLFSWSVPYVVSPSDLHYMTEPTPTWRTENSFSGPSMIHPKGVSLGILCPAGTTSSWMQQSALGPKNELLLGHVPRSSFGCIMGVGQTCRKLHRSLGENFERHLFRPDFLDHEILCPGDFVLFPPAFLPSLYSLILDSVSARIHLEQELDHVGAHLEQRLRSAQLQNTSMMSLQLLVLRSVEKIAAISKSQGSDETLKFSIVKGMFATLVQSVRKYMTPLQFATLFLKVGRQIEPSCFPHLFPLPPSQSSGSSGRTETMDHLFDLSLDYGSISMSVAALPLLDDREKTKSMCAAIFQHCLSELDLSFDAHEYSNAPQEEKDATGDIFRYAMKLSEPETESTGSVASESDDSVEEQGVPIGSYSMLCGINRFFRPRKTKEKEEEAILQAASSFIVHGFGSDNIDSRLSMSKGNGFHHAQEKEDFSSVGSVTAQYILSSLFHVSGASKAFCWKKVAAIAFLLIGETKTGFHFCSRSDFNRHVRATERKEFDALIPLETQQRGGLVRFLLQSISECERQIDSKGAGHILDLILVLLGSVSGDIPAETPGLLLIAVTAGHAADRISDIMLENAVDHPLWSSYLEARFELPTTVHEAHGSTRVV
jgi:hypothetical protein